MSATTRSSWVPAVRAGSGSLPSARVAGSRARPSRVAPWRAVGRSSAKVSPARRAVKRMVVTEANVSSPPVKSRSIA